MNEMRSLDAAGRLAVCLFAVRSCTYDRLVHDEA